MLHHHKVKQVECNICGTKFINEKALESHILGTHEKVKNVVCEVCGVCFLNITNLEFHTKKKHTGASMDNLKETFNYK
jgi:hypothetical protein